MRRVCIEGRGFILLVFTSRCQLRIDNRKLEGNNLDIIMASNLKYKIAQSKKFGRYLITTKNIAPGEVIIREESIAVGPMTCNKDHVCFACLRSLSIINGEKQYTCSKCNVAPLCSVACETVQRNRHTNDECQIFRENQNLLAKNGFDVTGVLLVLRLWLIKYRNPILWEKINHMEAHLDKRMGTAVWKDRELNVVNMIRMLRIPAGIEPPGAELLQKLCSILDVNAFELRSPGALNGLLRGLYVEATLMAHDCRGNTHLTVDDNFQLTVFASIAIQQNEPILFNYTSSLLGTADRREHLREGKYFECKCSLCSDPYELQSHLSSLLCPHCKKGFVGMQNTSIVDPYKRESQWRCQICKRIYSGRLIRATLNICRTLIDECNDIDIKSLESLLRKLSGSLHTNHFLMLSLKQKLLTMYRKEMAFPNPQKKTIEKMLNICKEVYYVLDIVEPGISRLKGIMLYEMHLPMIILANRSYSACEISSAQLACQLEEARDLLKKTLTMLLLEPATTPEGKLAKQALNELRQLNQNISDVKSLPSEKPKVIRKIKENRKSVK